MIKTKNKTIFTATTIRNDINLAIKTCICIYLHRICCFGNEFTNNKKTRILQINFCCEVGESDSLMFIIMLSILNVLLGFACPVRYIINCKWKVDSIQDSFDLKNTLEMFELISGDWSKIGQCSVLTRCEWIKFFWYTSGELIFLSLV